MNVLLHERYVPCFQHTKALTAAGGLWNRKKSEMKVTVFRSATTALTAAASASTRSIMALAV